MGPELPPYLLLPLPPVATSREEVNFILIEGGKTQDAIAENEQVKKPVLHDMFRLRLWAFTIDLYSVLLLRKGVIVSFFYFIKIIMWQMPLHAKAVVLGNLPIIDGVVFMGCFYAYFFLSYFLGDGQSLGKKLLKLKIVNHNNENIQPWQAAIRPYSHLLEVISLGSISLILHLFKSEKTLSDFVSKTRVIRENKKVATTQLENQQFDQAA